MFDSLGGLLGGEPRALSLPGRVKRECDGRVLSAAEEGGNRGFGI